jgi:hypothetical protein
MHVSAPRFQEVIQGDTHESEVVRDPIQAGTYIETEHQKRTDQRPELPCNHIDIDFLCLAADPRLAPASSTAHPA